MAKVKQPLFSLDARRKLGDDIVYARRSGANIMETRPIPKDARSVGQLSWRHMFQKVVALWHALSAAEKEAWESLGRERHMTGYAWFVSQALRPNPGIYLPLQGGTMSGDIDMDSNRLLNLIDPTAQQEPVTKQYFEDNLPVGGYTEGARVTNSASLTIPNATFTDLTFDSERYDTDGIHSVAANTSRLTCKTAGKYVITGQVRFAASAVGIRILYITLNNVALPQVEVYRSNLANTVQIFEVSTIWDMAVNDYAELSVHQDSGGNLLIDKRNNYSPEFMMQRIG